MKSPGDSLGRCLMNTRSDRPCSCLMNPQGENRGSCPLNAYGNSLGAASWIYMDKLSFTVTNARDDSLGVISGMYEVIAMTRYDENSRLCAMNTPSSSVSPSPIMTPYLYFIQLGGWRHYFLLFIDNVSGLLVHQMCIKHLHGHGVLCVVVSLIKPMYEIVAGENIII